MTISSRIPKLNRHKTILIVDDEIFNLQALMIILRVAATQLGKSPDLIDSIVDQEMSGLGAVN